MIPSRQRTIKALIRLRGCAGWSAPLLFAYGIRQVFSWRGSFQFCRVTPDACNLSVHFEYSVTIWWIFIIYSYTDILLYALLLSDNFYRGTTSRDNVWKARRPICSGPYGYFRPYAYMVRSGPYGYIHIITKVTWSDCITSSVILWCELIHETWYMYKTPDQVKPEEENAFNLAGWQNCPFENHQGLI